MLKSAFARTGNGSQETGVRRQESGGRSQESGDRRQKTGVGDRKRETGDKSRSQEHSLASTRESEETVGEPRLFLRSALRSPNDFHTLR
jgi:hypothetical protein